MQIVNRQQNAAEHFALFHQMTKVCARIVRACGAAALGVERREIFLIFRVAHVHATRVRKRRAHACRARRQHTVEHVHTLAHRAHERRGIADAHQIARTVVRQRLAHIAERLEHHVVRLAHRIAANAEALEALVACRTARGVNLDESLRALETQVAVHTALHDGEKRLVVAGMRGTAALGPLPRQLRGRSHGFLRRRIPNALVELHHDVGADALLDVHVALGRPAMLAAVIITRVERDAVGVGLHHVVEAEQLESARIGEHGTVVVHELLHAAGLLDNVDARAHVQVIRVREHHLAVELAQLRRGDALHRGVRANGHEHGGMHRAMRGLKRKSACVSAGGVYVYIEKGHWISFSNNGREPFAKKSASAGPVRQVAPPHGQAYFGTRRAMHKGQDDVPGPRAASA